MLYYDALVKLSYASEHRILHVEPLNKRMTAAEVRRMSVCVVACVSEVEVSGVLLDFGKSILAGAEVDHKYVLALLSAGLLYSSVRKVARVETGDANTEHSLETAYHQVRRTVSLPWVLRSFHSRKEAMEWLEA